jgi:hypothetical protein
MLFMYVVNKYIKKLSREEFKLFYEKWFIRNLRSILFFLFLYFIAGNVLISEILTYGTDSFFISFLIYSFVFVIYGFNFITRGLRWFALLNQQYMLSSFDQEPETFSKNNVVN